MFLGSNEGELGPNAMERGQVPTLLSVFDSASPRDQSSRFFAILKALLVLIIMDIYSLGPCCCLQGCLLRFLFSLGHLNPAILTFFGCLFVTLKGAWFFLLFGGFPDPCRHLICPSYQLQLFLWCWRSDSLSCFSAGFPVVLVTRFFGFL